MSDPNFYPRFPAVYAPEELFRELLPRAISFPLTMYSPGISPIGRNLRPGEFISTIMLPISQGSRSPIQPLDSFLIGWGIFECNMSHLGGELRELAIFQEIDRESLLSIRLECLQYGRGPPLLTVRGLGDGTIDIPLWVRHRFGQEERQHEVPLPPDNVYELEGAPIYEIKEEPVFQLRTPVELDDGLLFEPPALEQSEEPVNDLLATPIDMTKDSLSKLPTIIEEGETPIYGRP